VISYADRVRHSGRNHNSSRKPGKGHIKPICTNVTELEPNGSQDAGSRRIGPYRGSLSRSSAQAGAAGKSFSPRRPSELAASQQMKVQVINRLSAVTAAIYDNSVTAA
jgi:hypothetical protein